jgi:hypothetical protein
VANEADIPLPVKKGLPPNHPSAGKHIRDRVTGPSWPETPHNQAARIFAPPLEITWGILLGIWVVYSRLFFVCPFMNDPDASKMAFGVAQRLQGVGFSEGSFYQLPKQPLTYVVLEILARIFHIGINSLPHFMAGATAVFMIGILGLGYHLGLMIWGRRVALASTTLLSISPMMWLTGEYPNSVVPALFVFTLAVWTMVISYRVKGGRWWLAVSGVLFACSTLMRLDMLLGILVPLCYAWFVDRRGLRRALILYAIWFLLLAIVWFAVFHFTPHDIFSTSQPHRPEYPRSLTMNWWGMGPFLFVFAFAGFVYRFITDRKPLPFIFFWILGFNTFYTGHLYSPRYFIPYFLPVSWLASFAIIALYEWLARLAGGNRPARILIIVILAFGASTMLTMSIIREGDKGTRLAWGEYMSYGGPHGKFPDGAAWYFMRDFHDGKDLEYAWIETGARKAVDSLFSPSSAVLTENISPIYVGRQSAAFVQYDLMASGWRFDSARGAFVNFTDSSEGSGGNPMIIQTSDISRTEASELPFLLNPGALRIYVGIDAIPLLLTKSTASGNPLLSDLGGWSLTGSYDGLDVLESSRYGGSSDGSIAREKELAGFFFTDPLPRHHAPLSSANELSHNGTLQLDENGKERIDNVSELHWITNIEQGQWLAIALNRIGLYADYTISIDGAPVDNGRWLARDIPGRGISRWDILLVPPELIKKSSIAVAFDTSVRGSILDLMTIQRNYPDSQYRSQIARKLGLEFSEIEVLR